RFSPAGIVSPIAKVTTPLRLTMPRPHKRPLSTATGTIGNPIARYSPAKPGRSGGVLPGGTRVPSGKMSTGRPDSTASLPAATNSAAGRTQSRRDRPIPTAASQDRKSPPTAATGRETSDVSPDRDPAEHQLVVLAEQGEERRLGRDAIGHQRELAPEHASKLVP